MFVKKLTLVIVALTALTLPARADSNDNNQLEVRVAQADVDETPTGSTRKCVRRAFEVNDFGKEGPISLAKQDLANYVKKIKQQKGVSNVTSSHKKPTCRLYLWLGPASEYTCRIEATICWNK